MDHLQQQKVFQSGFLRTYQSHANNSFPQLKPLHEGGIHHSLALQGSHESCLFGLSWTWLFLSTFLILSKSLITSGRAGKIMLLWGQILFVFIASNSNPRPLCIGQRNTLNKQQVLRMNHNEHVQRQPTINENLKLHSRNVNQTITQ